MKRELREEIENNIESIEKTRKQNKIFKNTALAAGIAATAGAVAYFTGKVIKNRKEIENQAENLVNDLSQREPVKKIRNLFKKSANKVEEQA
jgi:hypothetical protein